eukprot:154852-Ditylum_brightwellii.AAC.1
MLGHCTNEVLTKTLKHTTQYFPHQVKSENQSYPTQYHQKRLFPLNFRCLTGRTSAITIFLPSRAYAATLVSN